MIQRYIVTKDLTLQEHDDGPVCRWRDVEPLLPKWVACSERQPTETGFYRVIAYGRPLLARFSGVRWSRAVVTHWLEAPLPPLPESEATK